MGGGGARHLGRQAVQWLSSSFSRLARSAAPRPAWAFAASEQHAKKQRRRQRQVQRPPGLQSAALGRPGAATTGRQWRPLGACGSARQRASETPVGSRGGTPRPRMQAQSRALVAPGAQCCALQHRWTNGAQVVAQFLLRATISQLAQAGRAGRAGPAGQGRVGRQAGWAGRLAGHLGSQQPTCVHHLRQRKVALQQAHSLSGLQHIPLHILHTAPAGVTPAAAQ